MDHCGVSGRGTRHTVRSILLLFFFFNTGDLTMRSLTKTLVSFIKAEDGPTAVEYAVMLALIIVVCIAAITTLGSNANSTFSFVGSAIKPPATGGTGS
jgi:pilus assembly protein Flp/PilA